MIAGQKNLKDFASNVLVVLLVAGNIGVALKFVTFQIILNSNLAEGNILTGVFLPYFPNLLDSAFIISSMLFFAWKIFKKR